MATCPQTTAKNGRTSLRFPDFIIIGAAKSATTTLYEYLERHPHIFMSMSKEPGIFSRKEPQFFSRDSIYAKGLDWYCGLFEGCDDSQLCGEATTPYTHFPLTPNVPERILKVIPQVKFIYIMRHPVDRTFSHYKMHMLTGGVRMTFEAAMSYRDAIWEGWDGRVYLESSNYIKQIKHYLCYFPKNSFLFLFYEDFVSNPVRVLDECQRFLGVPIQDLTAEGEIVSNVASMDYVVRHRTTYRLRRIPGMNRIADALPQHVRKRVHRIIQSSFVGKYYAEKSRVPPMRPETRATLLEYFRIPNRELEDFLKRDLSCWAK